MNYDKKAIETLFDTEENLRQVIEDVIYNFETEGFTFEDAMQQFFVDFEVIASELVAEKVLGVDMDHHRVRTSNAMDASWVQSFIKDTRFKEFDKYVNHLFAELQAGDYVSAHKTYEYIFKRRKLDVPGLTENALNRYLEHVYKEKWQKPAPVKFSLLGALSEKQKLHHKLQEELGAATPKANPPGATRSASGNTKPNKI